MAFGRNKGDSEEERYGLFQPEDERSYGLFGSEEDNAYGDSDFYKTSKPKRSKKAEKAEDASRNLGDAEKSAVASPIAKTGAGAASVLGAEAGGSFINNVRGAKAGGKKGGLKGKLKKGGPIGAIIALFMGVGGLMLGGQSLMPFSLVSQFIGNFDSMGVSTSLRSRSFFRYQTNGGLTKDCIHTTFFGKHKFKITSKQSAKLKAQGIEEVEIGGKTYLALDDGSPTRTLIAPDDSLASKIGDGFELDGEKFGKSISFDEAYSKLADFRNAYNKASRTWKGSVGAWFDNLTLRFINRIDTSRNHFKNFRERVEAEEAGNTKSAKAAELDVAKSDMSKGADEVSGRAKVGDIESKTNDDGTKTGEISEVPGEESKVKAGMDVDDVKAEANKVAKSAKAAKASGAANVAQMTANVVCAVAGVIGSISILAAAAEGLQVVKLISSFTEAIQKTQYGEGVDSPIHVLSESLVTTADTKSWRVTDEDGITVDSVREDDESHDIEEYTTRENVSAMQSAGIAALYGNTAVNQNDPSVQSFNISGSFDGILKKLGVGAVSFVTCTIAKIATAAASAVISVVEAILSMGTSLIKDVGVSIATSIAIGAAVTVAIKLIVPKLAAMLTRDLISNLAGEDLGNALVSGANMYMGSNHRSGGGSLTNKSGLLAYSIEHEKVIADNAEYERANRSPFDATSQYTFLGSLLTKFASFYTTSYTASGLLTTLGNITKSSLNSILPSASAVTAAKMIEGTGNCPYLESIGAVGDAYCNPYIVTDVKSKTIEENPIDIIDRVANLDGGENFDGQTSSGAPKIKEGSNLSKYVKYCSERSSTFGFADQNISNDFQVGTVETDSEAANTIANSGIGAIPIIGDALDVIQNTNVARNIGWITGETCVAGNTSGGADYGNGVTSATPSWSEEGEYYQRFLEDQRLMESIDPEYTSSEVAYLEEYYSNHPLDNSYEGVLARQSGLTKENVIIALETMKYLNYIAEYDPSTRYDFTDDNDYTKKTYIDSGNNVAVDSETVITEYAIIYNDIRNRTTTV